MSRRVSWAVVLFAALPLLLAAASTAATSGAGGRQDRPTSWSPDGRHIVFERGNTKRGGDFRIAPNGRALERMPGGGRGYAWSPDGRRFAFVRRSAGPAGTVSGTIYLGDATGRDVEALIRENDPALEDHVLGWAPDGSWIAFQRTRLRRVRPSSYAQVVTNVWLVRPDGSGLRRLSRRRGSDLGASWSPDGTQVVFARQSARLQDDLYVARLQQVRSGD